MCLQVRSANVLQVHTVDTVYQCHASPQEARRACPSKQDIRQQRARSDISSQSVDIYIIYISI